MFLIEITRAIYSESNWANFMLTDLIMVVVWQSRASSTYEQLCSILNCDLAK